jgi:integrase
MARPSKNEEYPGVTAKTERNGTVTYRFRRTGMPEVRLPGVPGTDAFRMAYEAAIAGLGKTAKNAVGLPGRPKERTFGHAQRVLEASAEWLAYDDASTKAGNKRHIETFLNAKVVEHLEITWRNVEVRDMHAKYLRAYVNAIFATHRTAARLALIAIKKLIKAAIDEGWIEPEDDPSLSVKIAKQPTNANRPWPRNIREQYEARHPIGTPARTAYVLGLWLGNRRQDVASITWDDLQTIEVETDEGFEEIEAFVFTQGKNRNRNGGKEMFLPLVGELRAALAPLEREQGKAVLLSRYGEPYSHKALTVRMAKWTKQAHIPPGHTLHGLRKNFGVELAESGQSARAIMDAMGHSSMQVTDHYLRDVAKKKMMVEAIAAVDARNEKRAAAKRRGVLRVVK